MSRMAAEAEPFPAFYVEAAEKTAWTSSRVSTPRRQTRWTPMKLERSC